MQYITLHENVFFKKNQTLLNFQTFIICFRRVLQTHKHPLDVDATSREYEQHKFLNNFYL